MPTLAIRFVGGRYHATPWGSHVNEGVTEWPASPWRVLRSLIATGFAKLGWQDVPDDARRLMEKLAGLLPDYQLPTGQLAHTRHYMPIYEGKTQNTTKVFDTFVRVRSSDPLLIRYPVELSPVEASLLGTLAEHLGYFGRAESWVEAALTEDTHPDESWCRPAHNGAGPPPGGDQVVLLSPLPKDEYANWFTHTTNAAIARETAARGQPPTKNQLAKVLLPYPSDLLACLTSDTAFLQRHGWNQPPGSRRVLYTRPPHTLEARPIQVRRRREVKPVEAALLALSSDTVRGNLPPLLTRCVPQAEMLHDALVSILNKQLDGPDCPALVGKDTTGRKLEDGHRHVHYLPLDLDDDGRIDHYLLYAPMKLDDVAQRAVSRLRRTWTKGSDKDILVTCVGFGDLELFRGQLRTRGGLPVAVLPEHPAAVWSSVTPYVPARHLKPKRLSNPYSVEDDVRREIELRPWLPKPTQIEVFQQQGAAGRRKLVELNLLRFVKARRQASRRGASDAAKPQPPQPIGFGLRLTFAKPVFGPIAIGYGSHFGLGLFGVDNQ